MPPPPSPGPLRPHRPRAVPVSELAEVIGGAARASEAASSEAFEQVAVTGVEQRSEALQPGDLFAALPGTRAHGAHFVPEALARGAAAVLTDPAGAEAMGPVPVPVLLTPEPRAVLGPVAAHIYGNPATKLQLIGITGTSGKTTTSYLVEAGLTAAGRATALIGTIETRIRGRAVPPNVFGTLTTPEAPQLQAMFAAMVEQGVQDVVMEVSSHALALGRVDGSRFALGGFTNLSRDHLDFHGDFEAYFAAKRRLFEPDSPVSARTAVVCIDDSYGRRLAAALPGAITVATRQQADSDWALAGQPEVFAGRQDFTVMGPAGRYPARLRLPGRYNVANAVLAVALCAAAGVDPAVAATALAGVEVPGRMQRIERGQDFLAVVDYAHKPAAVESAIETLRAQLSPGSGRLAVVLGAGGDRDPDKRPAMGAAAARGAELVIVTDDNPRSEDPAAIRAAVYAGAESVPAAQRGRLREIGDRAAAIAAAIRWAEPGDVVLVAGKGHELGQHYRDGRHRFDDSAVVAAAIDARKRSVETNRAGQTSTVAQ